MVTAKVAPEHHLALAQAASRHASAAHALGQAGAVAGRDRACGGLVCRVPGVAVAAPVHPVPPLRRQRHHRRLPSLVTGVLPQMRRPRPGSQARHDDGRPVGTVPAVTAGSRVPVARITCRAPRETSAGCRADAGTRNGPGSPGSPGRRGRCCLVSRPPGHSGAAGPAVTCAHPAAGPGVAFPGPRAITGTAAQPRPRQAGLAVTVVLAGTAGLTPGARSRPDTAARHREPARPRTGLCPAPVPCATVLPSAAAGSRVAGPAPGAGG